MASLTGYDYGIRDNLVKNGVDNSSIGYNKSTGYVTIGGKDAIKAPKSYNNTAFTSQQDFSNDWNNYKKSLTPPIGTNATVGDPMGGTTAGANTGGSTVGGNSLGGTTATFDPYKTSNPFDTKLNDLIDALLKQANNPAQVDLNSIYNSPQYAAYQAQAQRGADQGIRAAQEALGSSGFGRSTALGERSQGIQNSANEYLNTQVIPMLMQQEQAAKQQQLQNQFNVLDAFGNQQGVYDNRFNNANQFALNKGELTGKFLDPQAASIIDQILQQKQAYGSAATPEARAAANQNATNLRNQLSAMGVDPSSFGQNKTLEQAQSGMSNAGVKTLGAQNLEFQKAQQEWENNFNQAQFDENKAARIWEQAFKEKDFAQSVQDAAASRGLQWASLNQRQKEFIADSAFREKQFKYEQDQDLLERRNKPAGEISAKESTNNYNSILDDIDSGATKEEARDLLSQNSPFLSDSDYKKLNDYINDNL